MRRSAVIALVGTVVGTVLGAPLAAQAPRAAADSAFAPLAFLVGSCWVGTFPDGKQTDEHCFEWVYGGRFVRDRHVVRGGPPYEGETLYWRDPATKGLAYWYWSSDGGTITGRVEPGPEGIVFPSRHRTAQGETELKAVWTRSGADAYRVWNGRREGDGWKELWTMELVRKR